MPIHVPTPHFEGLDPEQAGQLAITYRFGEDADRTAFHVQALIGQVSPGSIRQLTPDELVKEGLNADTGHVVHLEAGTAIRFEAGFRYDNPTRNLIDKSDATPGFNDKTDVFFGNLVTDEGDIHRSLADLQDNDFLQEHGRDWHMSGIGLHAVRSMYSIIREVSISLGDVAVTNPHIRLRKVEKIGIHTHDNYLALRPLPKT